MEVIDGMLTLEAPSLVVMFSKLYLEVFGKSDLMTLGRLSVLAYSSFPCGLSHCLLVGWGRNCENARKEGAQNGAKLSRFIL